jgi:hypothetical protein
VSPTTRDDWRLAGRDDAMISIALSSSDHLYLTPSEMDRLAETIRQELICRTTDQADDLVMVADISLAVTEAWRLIDRLVPIEDEVDWQNDGF